MNRDDASKGVILVVDDDPDHLGVLFDYLYRLGFKALLVQNSENALIQAEQQQPDVILLDILMPEINGFETCQRLKANAQTKEIPIIFMTALSDLENKIKGFRVGAVDYITKPFQQQEVFARVNAHLTIRRLQQQLAAKNVLLEQQVAQLQESNANKDRFIAMISHDLQSPFSSLRGLIQFATENLDGYKKEELENVMSLLGHSTDNLSALIENLLTWSRIQRGVLERFPQRIDLREIVNQNLEFLSAHAKEKQLTLKNSITHKTLVYADFNMVNSVLRNLLSNAIKFTRPAGTVDVSARDAETLVEVAVADSGIGIGQEHFAKLFRIDVRYKRLGTAHEKGTGLGLILCKEFVEKNGGQIRIESEAGQGTTVKFTIPKNPAA